MSTIDRSSPLPLYHQLKRILLDKIEQNELQEGDLLPSEQELQDSYGLSRTTVRQTLSDLVNEGWLHRERGRGTFITRPKFMHNPAQRMGASLYLQQEGLEPGWELMDKAWVPCPPGQETRFHLPADTELFRIRRLRLANGKPIGYHVAYVPPGIAEYINHDALTEGGSLRYLRTAPQMEGSHTHRTIEAGAAQQEEVDLLGMKLGQPVLLIERLVLAADGTPLELLWATYRGDRFKYQVVI